MERTISQRDLRNDNAAIMRALRQGDSFVITRNGVPVGRLTPIARRTFVPIATSDAVERAQRLERLQQTEALFEPIPFDRAAAHAYARIYAAAMLTNQKPRGARAVDMLVAATALSRGIPLYTRNPRDFGAIASLMEIVAV